MLTPIPARVPRDLDLHRLAAQRPLQPADLPAQLVGLGALGLARQALGAGGEELLAPLAQQAVGDVVLAAQLGHRLRSTQRREHDLGLLLRRELAVLPGLAQRCSSWLSGRSWTLSRTGRQPASRASPSPKSEPRKCQRLRGVHATTHNLLKLHTHQLAIAAR